MSGSIGDHVRPQGAEAVRSQAAGRWPRLWFPSRIGGQLAVLVVVTIVATHLVIAVALFLLGLMPGSGIATDTSASANRLAVVLRMLDAAPVDERRPVFALAKAAEPSLALTWEEDPPQSGPNAIEAQDPQLPWLWLRQILGPGFQCMLPRSPLGTDDGTRVTVTTPGGLTISADLSRKSLRPFRWAPILITILFLAAILSVLSAWAARALAVPLKRLAEAAEAFGRIDDNTPLPDRGPEEVLTVSLALGRMRDRVKRLIDDRTRMLAAISHDLRTPITRMRLRAEFIEDENTRVMTLRDLDQMNALVEAALSFVRDGQTHERTGPLDLAALVQTVCDEFADVGADVEAETLRHVLVNGRSDELQRALTNLIDNAVKYGGRVRVRMSATPGGAAIAIADEGPGIPPAEHAAMLQPFVRGDRARNLDGTPGFGLGLSIATAIVEAHSGRIGLANREPHGLVVTVELPRAAGLPTAFAGASTVEARSAVE